MKKILASLLVIFIGLNTSAWAANVSSSNVVAPRWEDYVPEKYQNPRSFNQGKSIAELAVGIALTDLIITAPVGIPMTVHATTKLKNNGYVKKKAKFESGLVEANKISDSAKKQAYYDKLLENCKMTPEMKEKQIKRQEKAQKKLDKANKKLEKKQTKETN